MLPFSQNRFRLYLIIFSLFNGKLHQTTKAARLLLSGELFVSLENEHG